MTSDILNRNTTHTHTHTAEYGDQDNEMDKGEFKWKHHTHIYAHTLLNAAIKITRHPEILCCQINCWQPSAARENQGCCEDRERARHFWWANKYRKHDYITKQDKTSTATSKPKHSHTTNTLPNAAIQITRCTQLNLNGFTPHTLPNAAIQTTRRPEIIWCQIRFWQPGAARENQGCCGDRERARHLWWSKKLRRYDYITKHSNKETKTFKINTIDAEYDSIKGTKDKHDTHTAECGS